MRRIFLSCFNVFYNQLKEEIKIDRMKSVRNTYRTCASRYHQIQSWLSNYLPNYIFLA